MRKYEIYDAFEKKKTAQRAAKDLRKYGEQLASKEYHPKQEEGSSGVCLQQEKGKRSCNAMEL